MNMTAPFALVNARVVDPSQNLDTRGGVLIENGVIKAVGAAVKSENLSSDISLQDVGGHVVAPGLVDMRVFLGEPGAAYRETFATASLAAAAGGVTTIVCMPDTDPVIDDTALVDFVLRRARDTSAVRVHTMAALTKGLSGEELTAIGSLKAAGAVAFTDGKKPLMNARVLRRALTYAQDFDALVCNYTQDLNLAADGVMNEGELASRLGLTGIPHAAEEIMLERDLRLVALSQARYHASAVSSAGSADILKRAKNQGLNVSAAVPITHLALNENDIGSYRTFFRLSPPLRTENDRLGLVQALADGVIDVIVSAHDPQDVEVKRQPFAEAADGAVGLETLLAVALRLVHNDDVSLPTLLRALSTRPAQLLGLNAGSLMVGKPADVIVIDIGAPWVVDAEKLNSKCKNTPFDEARLQGRIIATYVDGLKIYQN